MQKIARLNESASKRRRLDRPSEGTPVEVLNHESRTLLIKHLSKIAEDSNSETDGLDPEKLEYSPPEPFTEFEIEIEELSSTGDGLGYSPDMNHIYVVPFSVPGDRVLAKTYPRKKESSLYTILDLIKVLRPSLKRERITPGCKYFGICSGCQLQMMSYEDQLKHKKTIVEKAFQYFSDLDPSLIPPVGDTIASPLQYEYRTKLTPHFDRPPKRDHKNCKDKPPSIGFRQKNRKNVIDIENCLIGTPILNRGLQVEREKVHETFHRLDSGGTILLRESTTREHFTSRSKDDVEEISPEPEAKETNQRQPEADDTLPVKPSSSISFGIGQPTNSLTLPIPSSIFTEHRTRNLNTPEIVYTYPTYRDIKTYVSDQKNGWSTEYVEEFKFESHANSFFQNNNSILPAFIKYVRDNIVPRVPQTKISGGDKSAPAPRLKYLLDAYCGSGLFAVSLSKMFTSVLGIDVDKYGVDAARANAVHNGITNAGFITATAEFLFEDVPFPPAQSLVVMDPPRKGASIDFLKQLCEFGPARVVYVSCNVHTQARDVGILVRGFGGQWRYEIDSLRGADFFPQTGHVEGVCFLSRVENKPASEEDKPTEEDQKTYKSPKINEGRGT
ncbi:uncharacterized protein Z518_03018 [Rhinocladiella mackenziei CBS 650.93]|uniref:TRAM domain-containing protein n=1 Tax=Rhinocladiella mackenziei CBS 650.93 TaxID=1442369 RepID=A0A0D2G1F0_9EURO|nr:uncharacterized protein Z518_03018 [Rhinocladiella mackenziei CBS 650.93]KIX08362.1 hypothetical protein Z518_03018 [Rhinocladiella mackenziei CBS 650.93]